ncbi:MAG: glycosyltransferase family 2 protein [Pseudomonadota bacterium]
MRKTLLLEQSSGPRVTVITVVFNSKDTLEETICNVIHQVGVNLEYIVIDGGSKDGSIDIIRKYENSISYWVSEPDDGIYDAMNKGVAHANGDWVIFMNSGDGFFCEQTLARVVAQISGAPDIVYGDVQVIKNGFPVRVIASKKIKVPLRCMPACHQSMMIKTKRLQQYPYDKRISIAADFDNLCRILASGGTVQQIPIVVSQISAGGLSDVKRDEVYKQYQRISNLYFGASISGSLFYFIRRAWEKIKLHIKKILGMAH